MGEVKAGRWGQLWGDFAGKEKISHKNLNVLHLLTKVTSQQLKAMG